MHSRVNGMEGMAPPKYGISNMFTGQTSKSEQQLLVATVSKQDHGANTSGWISPFPDPGMLDAAWVILRHGVMWHRHVTIMRIDMNNCAALRDIFFLTFISIEMSSSTPLLFFFHTPRFGFSSKQILASKYASIWIYNKYSRAVMDRNSTSVQPTSQSYTAPNQTTDQPACSSVALRTIYQTLYVSGSKTLELIGCFEKKHGSLWMPASARREAKVSGLDAGKGFSYRNWIFI